MEAFSSREREGCVFSLHERTRLKPADYRPTAAQEMLSDWITYKQCGDPFILCTCRQAQLPAAPCLWEKEGEKVSARAEERSSRGSLHLVSSPCLMQLRSAVLSLALFSLLPLPRRMTVEMKPGLSI